MEPCGRHVLMELWGCHSRIDEPAVVRQAIVEAVAAAGATLLHVHVHRYAPQGVTGVAVLAESHFALHSWPERDYLAADLFTCGDSTDPQAAADVLQRIFEPQQMEVQSIDRGVMPPIATQAIPTEASTAE